LLDGTNGALGALDAGGALTIGSSIEGINGAEAGFYRPPDTNAAVGNNFVVETVNLQIRMFDKTTGAVLLDESLGSFFGAFSGGDPYVVYDDTADRWYVSAFNSSDNGLFLAVSIDGNPLDGFLPTFELTNVGGFPDYAKMGFNKDAIFLSFNDFGSGGGAATIASIDKAAALSGTLTYYVSHPAFQFRAMPGAQMHGDTVGGTEWFVSTDGGDSGGSTIRVTEMTNYFSNSPIFTYTSLPVTTYFAPYRADQPGGFVTVFPNTTTYEVDYRNGKLATALASGQAADGYAYPKGLYYQVDVSSGSPFLLKQGVIDPGYGVAVQMPSVAQDIHGNLGFTWIESSSSEYLSMWVGTLDTAGNFASYDAAPGQGFFYYNDRIGDYSTTVVDPTDGTTFWVANEYIGPNGASELWNTHITSFSLPPAVNDDWYSVTVGAGNRLSLQTYTPSDQGGQFINTAAVHIELFDSYGNSLALGADTGDGRNEAITFDALATGQYFVHVYNSPGTSGEYYLSSHVTEHISGQVYNDLNGNGALDAGDPGLQSWEIDVYDSSNNLVASQLTDSNGNFDIQGLEAGTFTVKEVLQGGWTQTAPIPPGTYTVTVTAGTSTDGLEFGNFQLVSFTGTVYNDKNGNGVRDGGEPALANWTINLLDSTNTIVATTTSDGMGYYTFNNLGPNLYTVQEVVKPGWYITQPTNPPGTYTLPAVSGANVANLDFGDFKQITVSGNIYNDKIGNGQFNPASLPLVGWKVDLLDSSNNLVAVATTDAKGKYSFSNVNNGTYHVAQEVQVNWVQTQPLWPTFYTFTAQGGVNVTNLTFGDHYSPALSPAAVIDNGQPGYSETGTWTTKVAGFNGDNRVAITHPSAGTTATATWDVTGVDSTQYDVYITYSGKAGYSTAAPFTVYDGGSSLGTKSINEAILVTQAHAGFTEGSYGGVGWLQLGVYTISSGELKVVLGNHANGGFVDADGVLIIKHGAGPGNVVTGGGSGGGAAGSPSLGQTIIAGPSTAGFPPDLVQFLKDYTSTHTHGDVSNSSANAGPGYFQMPAGGFASLVNALPSIWSSLDHYSEPAKVSALDGLFSQPDVLDELSKLVLTGK
jgi:hypothetical protein